MKKILIPLITLSMIANIYAVADNMDDAVSHSNFGTGIIKQGRDVMTNNNGTNTVKKMVKKTASSPDMVHEDETVLSPTNPSTGIIKQGRDVMADNNGTNTVKKIIKKTEMPTSKAEMSALRPMCAPLEKDLYMGDSKKNGKEMSIMNIQKGLIEGGYLKGTSTGYFGMATREAMKKYQKDLGLPAIGFVGKMTREKMMEACKGLPSASTTPPMQTAM